MTDLGCMIEPMKDSSPKSVIRGAVWSLCLLALTVSGRAVAVETGAHSTPLAPGARYYFDNFDPVPKPWRPGTPLNIEEVFKNYQYVEIVPDEDGKVITVNRYIQGNRMATSRYRFTPDGGLEKEE